MRRGVGRAGERSAQLVETGADLRAHGDDLGAGDELAGFLERELECLLVDGVCLGHGDHAALDAEQAQDGKVLVRLGPSALAGVEYEQEEVDSGCSCHHRADEALVSGDVHEREQAAVRELERRVTQVDRDAAALLLGQPVGVLSGQRPHEPCLAVVDVARGADGQGHR